MASFKNKQNKYSLPHKPTSGPTKTLQNKRKKIASWRQSSEDIPSCFNHWQHLRGEFTLPGPSLIETALIWMRSSQSICLETVLAYYHLYNLEDIFQYLFFFLVKERGSPISSYPSWVVLVLLHSSRKGVIFSPFKDPKWRLLLCLYCLLHSQHCLTPASLCKSPIGGFHYLLSKCRFPCFSPCFLSFCQYLHFLFARMFLWKGRK